MPVYPYRCATCGNEEERTHPMADVKKPQLCECGASMIQDIGRKSKTMAIRPGFWFSNHTRGDFLPDDVKGAGPYSDAHRRYAHQTYGKREL